MQKITLSMDRFKKKPVTRATKRGETVKMFLEKLNLGRNGQEIERNGNKVKLNPLTMRGLSAMLSEKQTGMDDAALYTFYKTCEYATNFGAKFWTSFKVAKEGRNVIVKGTLYNGSVECEIGYDPEIMKKI